MELIRGQIKRAQKICLYGVEGIGKSTFAAQFPNPIFIDIEGSTNYMDVARLPKPSSWTMLLEHVRYIKAHPNECGTLIIDTADWAEQLCITELCAKSKKSGIEDFGYGKGYTYLAEEFGRLLNLLEELIETGINVVFTAHAQMRKFEQPDEMGAYDRWELKLQKKTAPLVKEWADMVLFANYKTYVVNVDNQGVEKGKNKAQGGSRVMYTTHHPCWDAKNRHDLDPELKLDYAEIAHYITVKDSATQAPPTLIIAPAPTLAPEPTAAPQSVHSEEVSQGSMEVSDDESPVSSIPIALVDLMRASCVTEQEIQQAVASKGYYPVDTPITNYDSQFIAGVLVGAWGQVYRMIQDLRDPNDLPF